MATYPKGSGGVEYENGQWEARNDCVQLNTGGSDEDDPAYWFEYVRVNELRYVGRDDAIYSWPAFSFSA